MRDVRVFQDKDSSLIIIDKLSEELKNYIIDNLQEICHSEDAKASKSIHRSFDRTLRELVDNRFPKNKNMIVGIIGELLLNVIVREFTDLRIISPFFNMEQRDIKKGFDIISVDKNDDCWIIESKSGELGSSKNNVSAIRNKIHAAKRDLKSRLNESNSQLWLNAINSVRAYIDDKNEKNTIVNIIEHTSNTDFSNDKNVILGAILFNDLNDIINLKVISDVYQNIENQYIFKRIKIIAIHKNTYLKIYDFLKDMIEEENEEINNDKII